MSTLRGQLLIASPTLGDPNFRRSVVLVADHGEEGAMGIILNRPLDTTVGDTLPDLTDLVEPDQPLYQGGPVQLSAVLVLAEWDDPSVAADLILGDVGFATNQHGLEDLATAARRARAFVGYAGWGPGQLEGEVEREDWIVEPAQAGDLLAEDPEDLWRTVLARKGGRYALVARMPEDPSVN